MVIVPPTSTQSVEEMLDEIGERARWEQGGSGWRIRDTNLLVQVDGEEVTFRSVYWYTDREEHAVRGLCDRAHFVATLAAVLKEWGDE